MRIIVLEAVVASVLSASPVTLTRSLADGVDLRLAVPYPTLAAMTHDGGAFARLEMEGAGVSDEVGCPAVPVYRQLVEVPFGAELTSEAVPTGIRELPTAVPIAPRQEPEPKSGPVPPFAFDAKAYERDEFGPEIGVRVADVAEVRGHRVALIELRPLAYNPVRGAVRVCGSMDVRLRWTDANMARTRRMRQRYDSPLFGGRLDGMALNSGSFRTDGPPTLPVGYLIVVPDSWRTNVEPLADWRRRKGWNVFVRTLSEVGGGQSGVVKAYLQDAYDNWPIPPSIVMLVGDVNQIGFFTGQGQGSPPTDLNYSLLEGADYLPDIDLSRASVATAAQLDSLIQKTLLYEQNRGAGGTEWQNKAYFIASSDGGNHQVAEATHQYVMRKIRPMGVVCDSIWLYYGQGTPIVEALNRGRSWVTYSGHGNTDKWADPNFGLAQVHALANTDLVPWVQTYACLSGDFSSSSCPECFSEAWIRNGRRGAIAHMASSVTSYWTEDDTLERRVFDYQFDSLYCLISGGMNRAKLSYYVQMGNNSTTRRYLEMYNIVGDGAIDVYSQEPAALNVTHPPVIPLGAYPLAVTVQTGGGPVENALVCATAKGDTAVFASAYTNGSGQVVLNITTTAPDSVFVTVTGHNLETYAGACLALPSAGPYVMLLRAVVDDSVGGNNDHVVNPGETVNLPTWLKNWGNSAAANVRAWLRCTDPNVTLLDTLRTFGTIAARDSAYSGAAGYAFRVAPACTNGYGLRFSLVVKDENDSAWTSPLTLVVGAPVLVYASSLVEDPPPGGNGNGMIEPGEDGDLMVVLRNTGLGHAHGVTAVLRSGDSRLVVLDSTGAWGTIPRDSTGTNASDRFSVSADGSIPRETQIPCTLLVSVGGATCVREFSLGIGVVRTCDPIPDGPRSPSRYYAYDITDTLYTEAPQLEWVELRGLGTRLNLSDDQTVTLNLPVVFGPFNWYGERNTQLSVCSNGWISPGSTTSSVYSNTALPDNETPVLIAACWDDLYPPSGGGVLYYHDAANHRFVIEWDSVRYYSGTNYDKFEIVVCDTTVLTETGDNVVLMQYLTANGYSSNTIGVEDPQSVVGINCLANGAYHRGAATIVPGMAIKYTTNPPRPRVGFAEPAEGEAGMIRLALLSCRPNPVRGWAQIAYSVPREMEVTLGVFDAAGRKVRDLGGGRRRPGRYEVDWNRIDDHGRRTAPGVYFYRLDAEGVRLVQKAVALD